jgi:hypothetical protein
MRGLAADRRAGGPLPRIDEDDVDELPGYITIAELDLDGV